MVQRQEGEWHRFILRWYSAAAIFGINYPLKLFGRAAKAAVVADDDEPAYDGDSVAKFDCRDYRRRGEGASWYKLIFFSFQDISFQEIPISLQVSITFQDHFLPPT